MRKTYQGDGTDRVNELKSEETVRELIKRRKMLGIEREMCPLFFDGFGK